MKEQKNSLQVKDLLLEVSLALKDVFVATIEQDEEKITMLFPSGEKFFLTIEKSA